MPNGPVKPSAKLVTLFALVPSAEGRMTLMRPAAVSARKISPFGATRMVRGACRLLANTLTTKPAGTCSFARCGLGTILERLAFEGVSNGGGKFATLTRCTRPGASCRQSSEPAFGCGGVSAGATLAVGFVALTD